MESGTGQYGSAHSRWAGVGPYYAMFPIDFADDVVRRYTEPGDLVLDPFAGRGTAVFSASAQQRVGIGVEINPVGWVYANAKLAPARHDAVAARIRELGKVADSYVLEAVQLPDFFHHCFSLQVRQFLVAARSLLRWRDSQLDRTVMALLLVYLHGKRGAALSNQMRQAKSMAPDYAVRWWKERDLKPPDLDPIDFLVRRLKWRYAKGKPCDRQSRVLLRDSVECLPKLRQAVERGRMARVRLLLTSPPYYGVTNYHYDQWLRIWLLGGAPNALRPEERGEHRDKFENIVKYQRLLDTVFGEAAGMMARGATVYVRTDRREATLEATHQSLCKTFPRWRIRKYNRPFTRPTQTQLFGDGSAKVGEVDLVVRAQS